MPYCHQETNMALEFSGLPRAGVFQIEPYVPGARPKDVGPKILRLASNENPYGPSTQAVEAYQACASDLHRYPDGAAVVLREALATHHDIDAAQIVCGAGSDELISMICRAYAGPGDEVLYSQYGFLMYKIAALACGATPVTAPEKNYTADLDAILAAVTPCTRIVFLANPNNPTGSMVTYEAIEEFRRKLRDDVLLVVDAAYAEYVRDASYHAGDQLVQEFGNTIILRTFSKIYGLAALRLGWAYAPPNVADMLNRVRGPFNVSAPAQAAGIAALHDTDHLEKSVAGNARVLATTTESLRGFGYRVLPSFGNFVLVDLTGLDHHEQNAGLMARSLARFLEENDILVRPVGAYGLHHHLRITIGLPDDMLKVCASMKQFVTDHVRSAA
jgi:histidinol-phosphate aminotransferase